MRSIVASAASASASRSLLAKNMRIRLPAGFATASACVSSAVTCSAWRRAAGAARSTSTSCSRWRSSFVLCALLGSRSMRTFTPSATAGRDAGRDRDRLLRALLTDAGQPIELHVIGPMHVEHGGVAGRLPAGRCAAGRRWPRAAGRPGSSPARRRRPRHDDARRPRGWRHARGFRGRARRRRDRPAHVPPAASTEHRSDVRHWPQAWHETTPPDRHLTADRDQPRNVDSPGGLHR